jgi:phenylacetate-coenzyme A ligase PaaK-like adenylate-forming protein
MKFDFSQLPLGSRAFSTKPMTFCDPAPRNFISAIIELLAIETGNRRAREHWQKVQLGNLLKHASQRSVFWRRRIGTRNIADVSLSSLPILSRSDVVKQVEGEGPLLLPRDHIRTMTGATSGSSGAPVKFFSSEMNGRYNAARYAAQFLMEGLDLGLNSVKFNFTPLNKKHGLKVTRLKHWLEPLTPFIRSGSGKIIEYFHPNMKLLRSELERDSIGYLVASRWTVETLLQYMDVIALKDAGMAMWIPLGDAVDPKIRGIFTSAGIPVRANYSSEEIGLIGYECETVPGNYHVATSNVLVEVGADSPFKLGDQKIGRVLVTHLHSYATPFIRYDIGDLASLARHCACGHDGPTLSNVYGREKTLVLHSDGRVSPFYVNAAEVSKATRFKEYRIRQTGMKKIVAEISAKPPLAPDEISAFAKVIKTHAGEEFEIEAKAVSDIDWGSSVKRLGFRNEMLRGT